MLLTLVCLAGFLFGVTLNLKKGGSEKQVCLPSSSSCVSKPIFGNSEMTE